MAPAGTPEPIVNKLSAEVDAIVRRPGVVERFKALGADPVGGTPKSLGDFIARETPKWRDVVKASGARVD
jgi:tripartite-type tricarboxylate transporter receptor subunit TctC